jgi:hypothetical protein
MKESELYNKFILSFFQKGIVFWKAPAFQRMRWDIFGVADVIGVNRLTKEISFYQLTTLTNLSHRRKKIYGIFSNLKFHLNNCYIYAWDKKKDEWRVEKINDYAEKI